MIVPFGDRAPLFSAGALAVNMRALLRRNKNGALRRRYAFYAYRVNPPGAKPALRPISTLPIDLRPLIPARLS
jgi:hypothetical protein